MQPVSTEVLRKSEVTDSTDSAKARQTVERQKVVMGKSKGRGQKSAAKKDPVASKVAGVRKAKTKVVSTNLKRINFQNKAKTEAVDAAFDEVKDLMTKKKPDTTSARQETLKSDAASAKKTRKPVSEEQPPDVNMAAEELSKL